MSRRYFKATMKATGFEPLVHMIDVKDRNNYEDLFRELGERCAARWQIVHPGERATLSAEFEEVDQNGKPIQIEPVFK